MSKPLRIALIVSIVLAAVLVLGTLCAWYAIKREPVWYVEQVEMDPKSPENRAAGEEMEQAIAQTVSGFEKSGKWAVVFTEQQVNGYLAATLVDKHPDLLPPELKNPRIKIEPDGVTLAARIDSPVRTVVSLKIDVFLPETNQSHPESNTVAIRFRQARAGSLPWSLGRLTQEISAIAKEHEVPLHWTRLENDPVAVLTIVPSHPKKTTRITACQFEAGKFYLSGETKTSKSR